ncbi:arylsulfatase [Paraglaciecola aquimarina]|uniref:Arylsulfatase n=1 Tax=Paraglaciecola algarum TaxID=3050085 RepID=A0ABS9D2F3_9ALTE|nr:arylsulfatase [Paraglaciecola sp. G1-23]MCF2947088.1 arylsulfatase [Paraglaciecola sp. G1-23]
MNFKIKTSISLLLAATLLSACNSTNTESTTSNLNPDKPNIVIFYVDDLGYGDVGVYGAKGVETPNIDALANNGLRFTDAHSSAATCTPSRYSLLTGEHAFRKKAKVLQGDAKMLIDPGQPTIASLVKKAGYKSAVVGKWHLGLGDGKSTIDWNQDVKPGPLEIGFDYSYLLPATGDRVPTVYLENYTVEGLSANDPLKVSYTTKIGDRPVGREHPELLRQQADNQHADTIVNGISRIGYMQGGKSAEWKDEDFYTVFTDKANHFIAENKNNPFFLFFSFHDIHVPRLPHKKFQGKSEMGLRGDAIVQMDYITGQVVDQLKKQGVLDNTLIIFTSDNGPVLTDGYDDEAIQKLGDHKPAGPFRGGKYSAYEAGTRVPTIVHYPNRVKPGVNNSLMSQIDVYASIANMLNIPMDEDEAIDSEVLTSTWLGESEQGRTQLIEESYTLSLRLGDWKYIAPSKGTNDWIRDNKNIEGGFQATPQLFYLPNDLAEQNNLASQEPSMVEKHQKIIDSIVNKTKR